uniref:CD40 molecule, TNF receptor superfamily member 5 n=1 Tax=Tetraodon nigroviridis TaxID=99883 RepID=H3D4I5_TETNG
QYKQDGGCCKLCPPGTSMTSLGNCLEPQCQKCGDGEYQDTYSKEPKCHLQPYCDPNKNFQIPKYNLQERSVCSCREGFHCSSSHCTSCVPHTACNPGYRVKLRGNHSKDTECERCSEGTFSQNSSQTEACQQWTECPWGWEVVQAGTDTSDQICGAPRTHAVVISVVVIFIVFLVVVGLIFQGKVKSSSFNVDVKTSADVERTHLSHDAPGSQTGRPQVWLCTDCLPGPPVSGRVVEVVVQEKD